MSSAFGTRPDLYCSKCNNDAFFIFFIAVVNFPNFWKISLGIPFLNEVHYPCIGFFFLSLWLRRKLSPYEGQAFPPLFFFQAEVCLRHKRFPATCSVIQETCAFQFVRPMVRCGSSARLEGLGAVDFFLVIVTWSRRRWLLFDNKLVKTVLWWQLAFLWNNTSS